MPILEDLKRTLERITGHGRPQGRDLLKLARARKPHLHRFRDDGETPNNPRLPLVLYRTPVMLTDGLDPAAGMLIDQAVVAYQNFLRVTGWTGNTALMVEAEFFGQDRPSAQFRDRYGDDGRSIRGLTVEQHIARLGEELMPLAERFGRIMRDTVAALEGLRTVADQSVERSTPIVIPIASLLDREGPT